MELKSFKELLLKKTQDSPELQTLIKFAKDDIIVDHIIESLEKASHKGDKANSAITSWAGSATPIDTSMLHDALGHHVSRYKAARAAGNDDVANKHLERTVHLADFAAKASKHSLGKLHFDYVPTHAWEMNATGDATRIDSNGRKKFVDDQQGLKRRLRGPGSKFPDYRYLENNPHPSYKNKGRLRGHQGQYPFEEMKVNDKHIHIDDVPAPTKYEPHEFDQHPLFQHEKLGSKHRPTWEHMEDDRGEESRNKFADASKSWLDSEHVNSWLDRHDKLEQQDPEKYASRGKSPMQVLPNVKRGELQQDEDESTPQQSKIVPPPPPKINKLSAQVPEVESATAATSTNIDTSKAVPAFEKVWDQLPDQVKHALWQHHLNPNKGGK